jgi:hypothetical protein
MHGIIIGLNNPNPFFYLTNRVKQHENNETPLAESDRLSVFQLISANYFVHFKRSCEQKEDSAKSFTRVWEKGYIILETWNFG